MEFEEFYREEARRVMRTCWLVTLDDQAAADIAQETMLRVWERWDYLRHGDPAAWARTVALNLGRSRWRRLRRENRSRPAMDPVPPPVGIDDDLLAALRRLSTRQREALVLFYWGDLPLSACAEAMGVGEGTVKQHLGRARAALRADPSLQDLEGLPT